MGKSRKRKSSHRFHFKKKVIKKEHRKAINSQFKLINGDAKPRKIKVSLNAKRIEKVDRETKRFHLLHCEIIEYANSVEPKGNSLTLRELTIKLFTDIMDQGFPNWTVKIFGSYAQGTQTKYSDLDFVVFKSVIEELTDMNMLFQIKRYLWKKYFAAGMRLIHAKVPIIKLTCRKTGINMDISVNRSNGCEAAIIINSRLKELPVLHPIILLLKMLLRKNNLNEPHTGGMSSFLLFSLVFFYYQRIVKNQGGTLEIEPRKGSTDSETTWSEEDTIIHSEEKTLKDNEELLKKLNSMMNYGKFLNGFLKFCSTFDYENLTISLRNGGMFLIRKDLDDVDVSGLYDKRILSVENFQDKTLNIGRSCFNFFYIRELFQKTLFSLEKTIASNDESILSALNL